MTLSTTADASVGMSARPVIWSSVMEPADRWPWAAFWPSTVEPIGRVSINRFGSSETYTGLDGCHPLTSTMRWVVAEV